MSETQPDSFMSAGKLCNYSSERGAENYRRDYEDKLHRKISDRLERRILNRYFDRIAGFEGDPCGSLLDVPCGAGRLLDLFRSRIPTVFEADWSHTMLSLNRRDHPSSDVPFLRCSALELPFAARTIDITVSIRLSHHLDRIEDRETHLRELLRVSDRAVIATWFSANSLKNILREARVKLFGKSPKNVLHTSRVREIAREHGFRLDTAVPLSRLSSGHRFGLFLRL
jgi:ubiquinone/menaquinone biosynthesis C-methylase UbiE